MTSKDREIIRRLCRGDLLTMVETYDIATTVDEFYVGMNGKSSIRVNRRLALYLIRNELVEPVNVDQLRNYQNTENITDYTIEYKYVDRIMRASIFSLGDTVEYCHSNGTNKRGVITKQEDPIGFNMRIDGITNAAYGIDAIIGGTRKVLMEKTIKEKEIKKEIRESSRWMIVQDDEEEIVADHDDTDDYRYFGDEFYE